MGGQELGTRTSQHIGPDMCADRCSGMCAGARAQACGPSHAKVEIMAI